jgi:hypothetical protein
MKTKKLTAAEAYAKQVKADRKADALARIQDPVIQAEAQRIHDLYIGSPVRKAEPQKPEFKEATSFTLIRLPGGAKASKAAEKAAVTRRRNRNAK